MVIFDHWLSKLSLVFVGGPSYLHEGRQRIILQAPGALVALSLP